MAVAEPHRHGPDGPLWYTVDETVPILGAWPRPPSPSLGDRRGGRRGRHRPGRSGARRALPGRRRRPGHLPRSGVGPATRGGRRPRVLPASPRRRHRPHEGGRSPRAVRPRPRRPRHGPDPGPRGGREPSSGGERWSSGRTSPGATASVRPSSNRWPGCSSRLVVDDAGFALSSAQRSAHGRGKRCRVASDRGAPRPRLRVGVTGPRLLMAHAVVHSS